MSSLSCEQVNSLLIDFVELELSFDDFEKVKRHVKLCSECNKEYDRMRTMLNKIHKIPVYEPGEAFWNELPEKVLLEVNQAKAKQTTADIIDFYRSKHKPTEYEENPAGSPHRPRAFSGLCRRSKFSAGIAIAATMLLVINVITFSPKSDGLWFDPLPFIAKLNYQTDFTSATEKLTAQAGSTVGYAFIEQHATVNYSFYIGSILAESMILAQANEDPKAREGINRLFNYLQVQAVPVNVSTYLGQTIEAMDQEKPVQTQLNLLIAFQREYEKYIIGKDYDQLVLFRAGLWTLNVGVAAAARNEHLLRSIHQGDQINYLQKAFARIDVAPGVNKSLQRINELAAKKPMSDRDFRSVEQAVANLQSLLG